MSKFHDTQIRFLTRCKKMKLRYKILLVYVGTGALFACCLGCCTHSLWNAEEYDDPNGFCFREIAGTVFTLSPDRSEVTLVADVRYRTVLSIIPAIRKPPCSSSWNQWLIACNAQQSVTFPLAFFREFCRKNPTADIVPVNIAANCLITELIDIDGRSREQTVQTPVPRAWQRKDGLLCVDVFHSRTAAVHPADAAMLKSAPFFLLRDRETDIYAIGCVHDDRLVTIGNYELIEDHCHRYRLADGWIIAWKVAVTPLNVIADVVTMPWQVCVLIFIKCFLPPDLC